MKVHTFAWNKNDGSMLVPHNVQQAQIVFYFISPDFKDVDAYLESLKNNFPGAKLIGCTTGGEIFESEATQDAAIAAAIKLDKTSIEIAETDIVDALESYDAGKKLATQLQGGDLKLIFVLSDGLKVNGSELVRGITENAPPSVAVTGGLAGDGSRFQKTGVGINGKPISGKIAAVGFYGDDFLVSYGSVGGWIKFGPERVVTKSQNNILYELDGKPALDLYKKYLGEEAEKLPGSGLLFPLSIRPDTQSSHDVVRTIVGVDEAAKSLIFAGAIPQGYVAQLMRGSIDNLVEGAGKAANYALEDFPKNAPKSDSLGILVSCIGRNLLMGQHVSSEVEAVKQVLEKVPLVGFYSYGEICHHPLTRKCGLHNQTMTITLLSEAA